MLVALWDHLVPVHAGAAVLGLALALVSYDLGNWNAVGQYGLLYFLLWAAIRWTRVQNWEKYGDFSYGVYIFAWPLMTFACFFGLHERGMLVYFAVIVVATHAVAYLSWHLIEKPAMSLKNWSPRDMMRARRPRASSPTVPEASTPGPAPTTSALAGASVAPSAPTTEEIRP